MHDASVPCSPDVRSLNGMVANDVQHLCHPLSLSLLVYKRHHDVYLEIFNEWERNDQPSIVCHRTASGCKLNGSHCDKT